MSYLVQPSYTLVYKSNHSHCPCASTLSTLTFCIANPQRVNYFSVQWVNFYLCTHLCTKQAEHYRGATSCISYPLHETSVALIPQVDIKEWVTNSCKLYSIFLTLVSQGLVILDLMAYMDQNPVPSSQAVHPTPRAKWTCSHLAIQRTQKWTYLAATVPVLVNWLMSS